MAKLTEYFYTIERQSFQYINQYFYKKRLNTFFRVCTNAGGAVCTISLLLLLLLFTSGSIQYAAIASAIALTISHIPVAFVKKIFPRKRPYLVLDHSYVMKNPLQDHSFPSGHTTAIFSVIIPFILLDWMLMFLLLPIGIIVGVSRIYLGLHFPSDVLGGSLLGSFAGLISFLFVGSIFPIVHS